MSFRLTRLTRIVPPLRLPRWAVPLRLAGVLALGAAAATCADAGPTGPARRVAVSLAPSFAIGSDDPVVAIARLVATLQQHPALPVVYQTSVAVAPGDSTVAMTLTVPLVSPGAWFRLTVAGVSASGDTVYRARLDSLQLSPSGVASAPLDMPPLAYSGPDTMVATVHVAPKDTTVRVGDQFLLRPSAQAAGGQPVSSAMLRFVSRDRARLEVSQDGLVTAIGEVESAWVVVATANSKYDSTRVTVVPARTFASIDGGPDRSLAALGDTAVLSARALDQDGAAMPEVSLSFATTDPAVATVSASGVVTATGIGAALIVIGAADVRDTVSVAVSQVPASVVIAPRGGTLDALGSELVLAAVVRDANGHAAPGASLAWSSLDTGVATVSSAGTVRSVSNGTAGIVVLAGDMADTVVVTVQQRATALAVAPAGGVALATGDTVSLSAELRDATGHLVPGAAVSWISRDEAVASVSASGVLVTHASGATTVIAAAGELSDSLVVTVTQEAASIGLGADSVTITAFGADTSLTAVVRDARGNPIAGALVSWSSSDPSVATISAAGVVTAVAAGRAAITARFDTAQASLAIGVRQDPRAVTAVPASLAFTALGESTQLAAAVRDRNGHAIPGLTVSWSSLSPGVATITADGSATAAGAGTGAVVAAYGVFRDTVPVVVSQEPAIMEISPAGGTLTAFSELLPLSAAVRDRNGFAIASPALTWSAGTSGVAEVTSLGVVRAMANGSAWITASAGAARDSVPIVVNQAVSAIGLSTDTLRLAEIGDTATVTAIPRDVNGFVATNHAVSFASSNAAVATVASSGLVTLTGAGEATVTASAGGVAAQLQVIKTPSDVPIDARYAWIRVTPAMASPRVGDTLVLVAEMIDAAGNATPVAPQWATSNTGRASVDAVGAVIALDTGGVTITATSNGVGGQARLQLLPAPVLRQFTFSPRTLYGVSGSPGRFSVSLEASDAGSGLAGVEVTFTGPGGVTQSCAASLPTSGTRTRGWWDCVVTIPAGSPAGTWSATSLVLTGSIVRHHQEASLARFGGTTLTVHP